MATNLTRAQQRAEARKHGALEHVEVGDWIKWGPYGEKPHGYAIVIAASATRVSIKMHLATVAFYRNGFRVGAGGHVATPATPEQAMAWQREKQAQADARAIAERASADRQMLRAADPYWRATWHLSSLDDATIVEVLRTCVTPEQAQKIRDYTPTGSEAK